ncbi:MAG TPA: hypothetical protein VEB59_13350 [Gemmatimonadales bacterium]|nr:hypothetical protein [Gemmatimonadales bacterium]
MRQLLRQVPMVRQFRQKMVATAPSKHIVIGAGATQEPGWIPTQIEFLNLLEPADWARFFLADTLDAMLAEHVWEHLTPEEGLAAARTCYGYLKPGGYLRVAVPDGFHPSPTYIDWVKVGGASPMQIGNDHKVLYTYPVLRDLFERAGFRVVLHEYFAEQGRFHYHEWHPGEGRIQRSKRFDRRNRGGELAFTSIILDAVKPHM